MEVRAVRTPHGVLEYPAGDRYVGRSLELLGEYNGEEGDILDRLVNPGDIVVEVGANIGAHTIRMARRASNPGAEAAELGYVIAIEPQTAMFALLQRNVSANGVPCVPIHMALGEVYGMCQMDAIDYEQPGNYGGVSAFPVGASTGEVVPMLTLDSMKLDRLNVLKIDVEGSELAVLRGGMDTIRRERPLIYVENDRKDQSPDLIRFLRNVLGYRLYWHLPPLWRPGNPKGLAEDPFMADHGGNRVVSVNMIGVHKESGIEVSYGQPVEGADDAWGKYA